MIRTLRRMCIHTDNTMKRGKDILDLEDVELPAPPESVRKNSELLESAMIARAYIQLALKKVKGVTQDDDIATAVTDMAHNLEERDSAEEYLELALEQLDFLRVKTENDWYEEEIGYVIEFIERRV